MKRNKILSIICAAALLLSATACASAPQPAAEPTEKTTGSEASAVSGEETTTQPAYTKKYSPTIQLTQNFSVDELALSQVPEGMSFDDNYWTQWCEEEFGITWSSSWIATDVGQNEQKINLAMVSGDLPDMLVCTGKDLTALIDGGYVLPIDNLLEQYATPLVRHMFKLMDESTNGAYKAPFSRDGQLYALPVAMDIWASSWSNNWIRQDILDQLNAKAPTNLVELEALIKQYKQLNPEGYAISMSVGSGTSIQGLDMVAEAYEAFPQKWILKDDGTLAYGSVQPQMKDVLATLSQWYANAWIDPEFVVKDDAKANETVVSGNTLTYKGSWGSVWYPFPDLYVNIPEANMQAFPPLKTAGGSSKMYLNPSYTSASACYAINAKCENPEAFIYLLNVQIENAYRNNEAMRTQMKELYDYDLMYQPYEERKPLNADAATPGAYEYDYPDDIEGPVLNGFGETHGLKFNQGPRDLIDMYIKLADVDKGIIPESELTQLEVVEKEKYTMPQNRWPALCSSIELFRALENTNTVEYNYFAGAPTQGMVDNNAYLNKLELEAFSKIIMGQAPLDDFDVFVQDWGKAGGEQITTEVNDWYKAL